MTTEQLTTCRLCPAFCGMVVELDGTRVVRARGDREHPISRGYLCPKGRGLPGFHHHPERLGRPLVGGRPTGWEETLDDLAGRLRRIVDEHGPESVALYTASGGAYDSAGRATTAAFFRQLGSHQRYTAVTVDVAPALRAAQLVSGYHLDIRPEWFPDERAPRLAVLLGSNPVVSHGYVGLMLPDPVRRLREYRAGGGELWVLDPRRTQTARVADHHLAVRPGCDGVVLAHLARELLERGADRAELDRHVSPADVERLRAALAPFSLQLAAERSGLAPEQLSGLVAAIRRAGKVAITCGTGLTFGPHALLAEWLRWVVLILTGSIDREGGMWVHAGWWNPFEQRSSWVPMPESARPAGPRSRPDLPMWFGEVPCAAMADEIEAGYLKALFITGGSPLTAFPDPDRTAAALRSLDLLVVVDVLANELSGMATHVLPAAAMLERADMPGGWMHHMAFCPALVPVGEDRRKTWWMFAQLGRRLGFDLLGGLDPDTTTDEQLLERAAASGRRPPEELFAAGPRGLLIPRPYGWVHERALPGGRWRLAPEVLVQRLPELLRDAPGRRLVLVSGREMHNHNRVGYGRFGGYREEPPALHVHPADAAAAGLADGDLAEVRGDQGKVTATARIDGQLRPGTVQLTHGWLALNVARLVSRAVDPLHGQPVMSAIPVDVSRISASGKPAPGPRSDRIRSAPP
jgi:anaerobic selenocysteine-containing dehydrogenase